MQKRLSQQQKKRYIIYIMKQNVRSNQSQTTLNRSQIKIMSQYVFNLKSENKQLFDRIYKYHHNKISRLKTLGNIINKFKDKYFQNDKEIQKGLKDVKQWCNLKQIQKISSNKDEIANENLDYQLQKQQKRNKRNFRRYQVLQNYKKRKEQKLKNQEQYSKFQNFNYQQIINKKEQEQLCQLNKWEEIKNINPVINLSSKQDNKNNLLKNKPGYYLFQKELEEQNSITNQQIIKDIYSQKKKKKKKLASCQTIVQIQLPNLIIAENLQILTNYLNNRNKQKLKKKKSNQFFSQKQSDSQIQKQNSLKKQKIESQKQKQQQFLYLLSQKYNQEQYKNDTKAINNRLNHQNKNCKIQLPKRELIKQNLLKITISVKLKIRGQQQENKNTKESNDPNKTILYQKNQLINNNFSMYKNKTPQERKGIMEKIIQYKKKFNNEQDQNEQQKYKKISNSQQKINNQISKKSKQIKQKKQKKNQKNQVFWTHQQRIKFLAFLKYYEYEDQLNYKKMSTYISNKNKINCEWQFGNFKKKYQSDYMQFINYIQVIRQQLNKKIDNFSSFEQSIFRSQLKLLNQVEREWNDDRFSSFENQQHEYQIFSPRVYLKLNNNEIKDFESCVIEISKIIKYLKIRYHLKRQKQSKNQQLSNNQLLEQQQWDMEQQQNIQKYKKSNNLPSQIKQQSYSIWTEKQTLKYLIFIQKNKRVFADEDKWKTSGIFGKMSQWIKTRNNRSCIDKHIYLMRKYKNVQSIINNLKQSLDLKQYKKYSQEYQKFKKIIEHKYSQFKIKFTPINMQNQQIQKLAEKIDIKKNQQRQIQKIVYLKNIRKELSINLNFIFWIKIRE